MRQQTRRARFVATAAVVALSVGGCSLRLETEPPVAPSPDAAERARDAAAQAEADLARALAAIDDTTALSPGQRIVADHEQVAAPVYAAIWGPVYVPFPDASPTAPPSPTPVPGFVQARAAAQELALAEALTAADSDLVRTFAAIAVARAATETFGNFVDSTAVADASELEAPAIVAERPLIVGGEVYPTVPTGTTLDLAAVETLIVAHDRAQYIDELVAGRSGRSERARALERSRLHRARAAALVELAGVDPRGAGYVVDLGDLADREARDALIRQTEREVALAYLAALAGAAPDDRAWLMSGAHDALAAQAVWPGFDPGDLPVLPGHTD